MGGIIFFNMGLSPLEGQARDLSGKEGAAMWVAKGWKDYRLLDCGGGEKLEIPQGLTVYRVRNIREAIETALSTEQA